MHAKFSKQPPPPPPPPPTHIHPRKPEWKRGLVFSRDHFDWRGRSQTWQEKGGGEGGNRGLINEGEVFLSLPPGEKSWDWLTCCVSPSKKVSRQKKIGDVYNNETLVFCAGKENTFFPSPPIFLWEEEEGGLTVKQGQNKHDEIGKSGFSAECVRTFFYFFFGRICPRKPLTCWHSWLSPEAEDSNGHKNRFFFPLPRSLNSFAPSPPAFENIQMLESIRGIPWGGRGGGFCCTVL